MSHTALQMMGQSGGLHESGWLRGGSTASEVKQQAQSLMYQLANLRDAQSVYVIPSLRLLPKRSFDDLEAQVEAETFLSLEHFESELYNLFQHGRRTYQIHSAEYGHVTLCQRYYQAITSRNRRIGDVRINFGSIVAGPGNARLKIDAENDTEDDAIITCRVVAANRVFLDEYWYKGQRWVTGDWVHVLNPDCAARPIVGQIFKVWQREYANLDEGIHIAICWLHRPEETVHRSDMRFYENEVFKTGSFVDHAIEDIIERIYVLNIARYLKGRPPAHIWDPSSPMYVVESRYTPKEHAFSKVKNYGACLPESVRKDEIPIIPFRRPYTPASVSSPFLRGIEGSGYLDDEAPETGFDIKKIKTTEGVSAEVLQAEVKHADTSQPRLAYNLLPMTQQYIQPEQAVEPLSLAKPTLGLSNLSTAAAPAPTTQEYQSEPLPAETCLLFSRDDSGKVLWFPGPPCEALEPEGPQHSLAYLKYKVKSESSTPPKRRKMLSRPSLLDVMRKAMSTPITAIEQSSEIK